MQDEEDVKRPREENGHANGHAQVQHRALYGEDHHTQDCQMQLRQAISLWRMLACCQASTAQQTFSLFML